MLAFYCFWSLIKSANVRLHFLPTSSHVSANTNGLKISWYWSMESKLLGIRCRLYFVTGSPSEPSLSHLTCQLRTWIRKTSSFRGGLSDSTIAAGSLVVFWTGFTAVDEDCDFCASFAVLSVVLGCSLQGGRSVAEDSLGSRPFWSWQLSVRIAMIY